MPLPSPSPDEEHDAFMDRCMGDSTMNEEYPNEDQRYAVCQTQWDKDQKSARGGIERRFTAMQAAPIAVETRADGKKRIRGVAAVYYDGTPDTEYELWPGVRERIKPGAFKRILGEKPDVRGLFNHDPNQVLGRTENGTLKLKSTSAGLEYEIEPPDTQTARDVVELLSRGDISGSSFSFIPSVDTKIEGDDGQVTYELGDFKRLFDVGPVTFPAYEATTAGLRSLQTNRPEAGDNPQLRARLHTLEVSARYAHHIEQIKQYA